MKDLIPGFPANVEFPPAVINNDWYNRLMMESKELYRWLKNDSLLNRYADSLHYKEGKLVVSDKEPIAYILIKSITKTLMLEPVSLVHEL